MKIKPSDYDKMRGMILDKLSATNICHAYEAYKADYLSDTRFAWDMWRIVNSREFERELYLYLNDDHIETALLHIIKDITMSIA